MNIWQCFPRATMQHYNNDGGGGSAGSASNVNFVDENANDFIDLHLVSSTRQTLNIKMRPVHKSCGTLICFHLVFMLGSCCCCCGCDCSYGRRGSRDDIDETRH